MAGVLLPLDTSELARSALPYALALANALREPLVLVGVWDRTDQDLGGVLTAVQNQEIERVAVQIYRDELESVAAQCSGIDTVIDVRQGRPADEILASIAEHRATALVISTHGRGGLQRAIWGSVADKLVHVSPVPALVVNPQEEGMPTSWEPKRLMVPLDGSDRAERALPVARQLAVACESSLALVRVVPWASSSVGFPMLPVLDTERIESELAEAAEAYLREQANAGETSAVLRGVPSDGLVHFVNANNIDLVVMTSHGRTGFLRWALGSVADRLLKSGAAPILLVPARD